MKWVEQVGSHVYEKELSKEVILVPSLKLRKVVPFRRAGLWYSGLSQSQTQEFKD